MPVERRYDSERNLFEVRYHGVVTIEEIEDNHRGMVRSGHWNPDIKRLTIVEPDADISSLDLDALQNRLIPLLQEVDAEKGRGTKTAWVMMSDLSATMGKLWELVPNASDYETFKTFATRAEALAWLDDG